MIEPKRQLEIREFYQIHTVFTRETVSTSEDSHRYGQKKKIFQRGRVFALYGHADDVDAVAERQQPGRVRRRRADW